MWDNVAVVLFAMNIVACLVFFPLGLIGGEILIIGFGASFIAMALHLTTLSDE